MKKVNVLAIYSESNHEYRCCDPTAVVRSDDWLDLSYFSACGRCSIKDQKVNEHLENRFRHEGKWMFWRFMLNQTMNRDFVIQLQWYTVLTDWTWTFAHLRNMLCQGPEGTSAPGKPVSPWRQVNVLAIYAESNHEYRLSDPTTVVHSTVWLDLDIILPAEDALPRTRKFINTWKTGFAIKASQCSSHLYWIKPWIQTFWSTFSGT